MLLYLEVLIWNFKEDLECFIERYCGIYTFRNDGLYSNDFSMSLCLAMSNFLWLSDSLCVLSNKTINAKYSTFNWQISIICNNVYQWRGNWSIFINIRAEAISNFKINLVKSFLFYKITFNLLLLFWIIIITCTFVENILSDDYVVDSTNWLHWSYATDN